MSKQNGRRKFTKTLTFKVLCGFVVLFLFGVFFMCLKFIFPSNLFTSH